MVTERNNGGSSLGGVAFGHAGAFWFGVVSVTAGVLLHLPMYLMGASTHYRLVGMPMNLSMKLASMMRGTRIIF